MIPRPHGGPVRPLTPRVARAVRAWFLVLSGIMACLGAFFLVMGAIEWSNAARSADWPSVEGTVLSSQVHRASGAAGLRRSARSAYGPSVHYEYRVDGVTYTGSKVAFTVKGEGERESRAVATRYPEQGPVRVHYDPSDPSFSVLEPGWDWRNAIPVAVGAFAIAFCAFFAWITLRITRRMIDACQVTDGA